MGKNNQVKVSVIIPVYNVEKYLRQCLDSLLAQSFPDFEVICIDDGSTDDSVKILQEYTAKDSRFSYYIQDHKNCGAARNNGMSHAEGKYYLFIDSDDMLTPDAIETMFTRAEKTNADICTFQFLLLDNQTGKKSVCPAPSQPDFYDSEVFSMRDNPKNIYRFTTPHAGKFFKKEFLQKHQLYFQETRYAEDVACTFTALALAERITALAVPLYIYRINNSASIIGSKDRNPTGFYGSLSEAKNRLIERDLYEQVEPAFLNFVASDFAYELESFKTAEGFEKAWRFIQETALEEFHLTNRPDDFFYAYPYYQLPERIQMMQKGSMLEYLARYPFALSEFPQAILKRISGKELLREFLRRVRAHF